MSHLCAGGCRRSRLGVRAVSQHGHVGEKRRAPPALTLLLSYAGRLPKSAPRPNKQVRGGLRNNRGFPCPVAERIYGQNGWGLWGGVGTSRPPREAGEMILPGKGKVRLRSKPSSRQLHSCELERERAVRVKLSSYSGGFDYPFPISNLFTTSNLFTG